MPREWLIQHRAGTLAEWAAAETAGPVLLAGERAYITDLKLDVVGDGVTKVASLRADRSDTYEPLGGASNARPMRWLGKKTSAIRNGGTGRVKWLYYGDSYAQKVKQGIESILTPAMGGRVGAAHLGALGLEVTSNATSGTITSNAADFTVWPTGATTTLGSAGASQTYGVGGVSFTCDQIKVIHANKGGGFKIRVDGVDNTTPTVTSAGTVTVTTISVARAAHTVSVVQTSGTPTIVGVVMEDTASSGIMYLSAGQGGLSLTAPTAQAWANWTTVLASVQPDVLTFEMKEGSSTLAADLDAFLTATQAGCSCDVVLIQSTPIAGTFDADQVAQNLIIRAKAAQYGVLTWDSYTPFKDYATLTALGFNGDGTHVTTECDIFRGALMMRDLGVLDEAIYSGRNVIAGQVYASDRLGLGGPAGVNGSLRLINTDIAFDLARSLVFRDATGATVFASFDSRNGVGSPSSLPRYAQVGPSMSAVVGIDADRLGVRKFTGGNVNTPGWVQAAGWIYERASQTLAANGAVTFTAANAECHRVALQANATSSSISSPFNDGQRLTISWVQDATGGRTYSWPGNARFAGGVAPSDTTANTMTSVSFLYDNTATRWVEVSRAVAVPTT